MTTTEAKRWTGTGAHRTRTIEWRTGEVYKTKSNGSCGRRVPTMMAKAECLCGWSEYGDDRANARRRARTHRTTTDAAPVRTNYEVVWGADESERILYADAGDGSWLSEDASARATRKLLEFIRHGGRAGLYVNGLFEAGRNVLASLAAIEEGQHMFKS